MPLLTSLSNNAGDAAASAVPLVLVLSASFSSVDEGHEILVTLSDTAYDPETAQNAYVHAGDQVAYTITGISSSDLAYGSITGVFTLDSLGGAQLIFTIAADAVTEGTETLTLTLDDYPEVSVSVTINDTTASPIGEAVFTTPGTYTWIAPAGVTSVSVVAIGGGGTAPIGYITSTLNYTGGGGGGLGWKNNIAVTPGNSYQVVVGAPSGSSYFNSTTTVRGGGGGGGSTSSGSSLSAAGGTYTGNGGGTGGNGSTITSGVRWCGGGGGAGGYTVSGGNAGTSGSTVALRTGLGAENGGGGGGMGFYSTNSYAGEGGEGGGTGLYGIIAGAAASTGGAYANFAGNGTSYGYEGSTLGSSSYNLGYYSNMQKYGGGAGSRVDVATNPLNTIGGPGAVRIMWGGGRSFPYDAGYLAPNNIATETLVHTLDNPNAFSNGASDWFGYAVAISGNYAIVGAHKEDDSADNASGKAYIFDVTTGNLIHTLNNPNAYGTSDNDWFGYAVAISGNYAIVGAPQEDDVTGVSTVESGVAYIFDVTTGLLLHILNNPNPQDSTNNDNFGFSVDISGKYAIVGAYGENSTIVGDDFSGKAYIFDVATGTLLHTLDNPNAYSSNNDWFGYAVAISGNHAIVGAHNEDDATGTSSGKAYIFDVITGGLVHTLDNPPKAIGTGLNDNFGYSVDISGNYAIVGAWLENQSNNASDADSGMAYIYNVTTGALLYTLEDPNPYGTRQGDKFGFSVSISGSYAVVSTFAEDDASGADGGKAYLYDVTTGTLLRTISNANAYSTAAGDYFGYSSALSGNYLIVGAHLEDELNQSNSGKAYIYNITRN